MFRFVLPTNDVDGWQLAALVLAVDPGIISTG